MASTILRLCALAATLAAGPALAADSTPEPHRGPYREGFLIGFSVGAGGISPDSCRDCGLALGLELHLGAVARRAVAVMLEGSVVSRGDRY